MRTAAIRNVLLLLLACVAGSVDAVSYVGLGHVFTANMTGNTVLLGLALGQAEHGAVVRSGLALVGFLAGCPPDLVQGHVGMAAAIRRPTVRVVTASWHSHPPGVSVRWR
jgi:uncharacterized membrane protein YoaK (UPF0700 family)